MERKLGFLALGTLLIGMLAGCGSQGPNDPQMSPQEESKLRQNDFTPEQQKAREQRPR
jgi:hypothetical protein